MLNDDKGLAGAIMMLVVSNGYPVVMLKENDIDKLIIDKNDGQYRSWILLVTLGFIAGLFGGPCWKYVVH